MPSEEWTICVNSAHHDPDLDRDFCMCGQPFVKAVPLSDLQAAKERAKAEHARWLDEHAERVEAEARIEALEGALERIEQYASGIGHVHKPALELIAAEAREALARTPQPSDTRGNLDRIITTAMGAFGMDNYEAGMDKLNEALEALQPSEGDTVR